MSRMHVEKTWEDILGSFDSVCLERTVWRFEFVVGLKRKILGGEDGHQEQQSS